MKDKEAHPYGCAFGVNCGRLHSAVRTPEPSTSPLIGGEDTAVPVKAFGAFFVKVEAWR